MYPEDILTHAKSDAQFAMTLIQGLSSVRIMGPWTCFNGGWSRGAVNGKRWGEHSDVYVTYDVRFCSDGLPMTGFITSPLGNFDIPGKEPWDCSTTVTDEIRLLMEKEKAKIDESLLSRGWLLL